MFEHIYLIEIDRLTIDILHNFDRLKVFRAENLSQPSLMCSNISGHNDCIQNIIVQSALLGDLLKSNPKSHEAKQAYKKRKDFLTKAGVLDNSRLKVLLNSSLRDTIIHFSEKIDDLQYGSKIETSHLVRIHNMTIYDSLYEAENQVDSRFTLYHCDRFTGGQLILAKVYNYKDNVYYNLNAKISLDDLYSDVGFVREKIVPLINEMKVRGTK